MTTDVYTSRWWMMGAHGVFEGAWCQNSSAFRETRQQPQVSTFWALTPGRIVVLRTTRRTRNRCQTRNRYGNLRRDKIMTPTHRVFLVLNRKQTQQVSVNSIVVDTHPYPRTKQQNNCTKHKKNPKTLFLTGHTIMPPRHHPPHPRVIIQHGNPSYQHKHTHTPRQLLRSPLPPQEGTIPRQPLYSFRGHTTDLLLT